MSESIAFLRRLAEQLQTQDNAYTASPNYCIQEHVQVIGIDMDYATSEGWFNCGDEYQQADEKKAKALDRYYDRYGKEPEGWTKLGYEWRWKYTGISFLTHDAAHAYVARCGHRHTYPIRVYVDSHYRNHEMREVRRLLAGPIVACIDALARLKDAVEFTPLGERGLTAVENARIVIAALDAAKEPHQ